jgi:alkylation response protein AidB-like acyl-CoA dehydrogenase
MDDLTAREIASTFLAFSPDETAIMHAAADFLGRAIPIERLHGPAPADLAADVRAEMGGLGWFGLSAPEDAGGSGLSAVEHAIFFREVGRLCGPVDILAQSLAVGVAQEPAMRAALMAGERAVVLAIGDGAGVRLLGDPNADLALSVDDSGASLHELSDASADPRPPLDPATTMRVTSALPAPVANVAGRTVWDLGELGVAAMLVGVAETALALIVDYAKVRETFGRKIGSYQAVRHPCADMALRLEAARSQLWYAAASMKEARADAQAQLDAAKHLANEAALANADVNIQLHGGIGVTDEHHAHLLLKRALLLGRVFGAKRVLLERLLHAKLQD